MTLTMESNNTMCAHAVRRERGSNACWPARTDNYSDMRIAHIAGAINVHITGAAASNFVKSVGRA